jgi:MinD superfamily P-loop ATPase
METVRGSDLVILVSEPTRFGIHDLRMVIGSLKSMNIPMALIVNKDGSGREDMDALAREEGIIVLMRIPLDRRLAEVYSRGGDLIEEVEWFAGSMIELKDRVLYMAGGGK